MTIRPGLRRCFLLALLPLMLLAACEQATTTASFHATEIRDASFGRELQLPDTEGRLRTLADFRGEVVAVYFGFLQCPDVCPTALSRAVAVKQLLGEDGKRFRVVFITVDPERDTPEVVRAYLDAFDPSFVGLVGSPEEVARTAKEFRVYYRKVPTGSSYTMDHTATTFVYNAHGKLRLAVPHALSAEDFAADVRRLLAE
ncbi:SCO family protein [Tepidiphilus baoligensis]|uniref:SCO family protein n=1 Tax=Tepidiphilus baoligensis TaxID=2698687 RepID=A0ABX1QKL9_9PROT|nr:SCO family protein [Tepidiphilus baoligensis]NMH15610.1 SCO family protein [Tepidiphilus baoligensis]